MKMSDSTDAKSKNKVSHTGDYEMSTYIKRKTANTSKQMRIDMPNLAKANYRHGTSNRTAATLCDVGIVIPKDSFKVIDRSKIRRDRFQFLKENHFKHTTKKMLF